MSINILNHIVRNEQELFSKYLTKYGVNHAIEELKNTDLNEKEREYFDFFMRKKQVTYVLDLMLQDIEHNRAIPEVFIREILFKTIPIGKHTMLAFEAYLKLAKTIPEMECHQCGEKFPRLQVEVEHPERYIRVHCNKCHSKTTALAKSWLDGRTVIWSKNNVCDCGCVYHEFQIYGKSSAIRIGRQHCPNYGESLFNRISKKNRSSYVH